MSPRAIGWAVPSLPPSNTLRFPSWTYYGLHYWSSLIRHEVFLFVCKCKEFAILNWPNFRLQRRGIQSGVRGEFRMSLSICSRQGCTWVDQGNRDNRDLMILKWSWACCSTHCQHWLSCCVLLTPPHASTFPPIQAATSPRLDRCD